MDMEWLVGLVAVFLLFGGGNILKTWIEARAEIERIKVQQGVQRDGSSNDAVLQAIQELRREVTELRETTTRFDMSFDAAITSLETRVEKVENTLSDSTQYGTRPASITEEPLTLRRG
ncbi:MAG: hypothetical protein SFU56_05640 [Capsulimonadales bacterium]|nr:hypothetical protein [Capsulimonadales bacterium]